MDGTLVDTEPHWMAAEHELVESFGGVWSDAHAQHLVGNSLMQSAEYIRAYGGVPMAPEDIVGALLDRLIEKLKERIVWQPGAVELITDLRAHGVPCALVTGSYRRMADVVISALPPGTFGSTVSGDEVGRGKPHPEPYLRAAAELGVAASECIVLEDSATGARSGLAAGARVVLIPNAATPDAVAKAPGAVVLDSLAGINATTLTSIVRSSR